MEEAVLNSLSKVEGFEVGFAAARSFLKLEADLGSVDVRAGEASAAVPQRRGSRYLWRGAYWQAARRG